MRNITDFINEEMIKGFDKFYIELNTLKENDNIFVCWIDGDNKANPYNVIVKKKNNLIILVNPDDENDIIDIEELISDNNKIAVFNNLKDAEKCCNLYNK